MGALVEHVIFGLLMVANLGLGLYFSFAKKSAVTTSDEVFLGSRKLRMLPLAMSVLASMLSAVGIVGATAHFYAYGLRYHWSIGSKLLVMPFVMYVVVPVFYKLKLTSIFEYLRMRYGNRTGLVICFFYMFLSQTVGAAAIFSASVAVATVFSFPIVWTSVAIGVMATIYTALGGLRAVVWTDCVQALVVLMAPITVVGKVIYDSYNTEVRLRPFKEMNIKDYIWDSNFNFRDDENVWAYLIGLTASALYREGLDQMVVQRYLAARSLKEAQRTALTGASLNIAYILFMCLMSMSLIYWFRDCDPLLSGSITNIDQILPFYVQKYLRSVPSFTAFFLAGIVSASLSTVSSLINSQTAVCFVDALSPFFTISTRHTNLITKGLAFMFGLVMTAYGIAVPYMGTVTRISLVMFTSISGLFSGVMILGLVFPWANTKGMVCAATLVASLQIWQTAGKFYHGVNPPRMPVSIRYCSINDTHMSDISDIPSSQFETLDNLFILYRLSTYWTSLLCCVLTVSLGLLLSFATGGHKEHKTNWRLTSEIFLKLWTKLKLLPKNSCSESESKGHLLKGPLDINGIIM